MKKILNGQAGKAVTQVKPGELSDQFDITAASQAPAGLAGTQQARPQLPTGPKRKGDADGDDAEQDRADDSAVEQDGTHEAASGGSSGSSYMVAQAPAANPTATPGATEGATGATAEGTAAGEQAMAGAAGAAGVGDAGLLAAVAVGAGVAAGGGGGGAIVAVAAAVAGGTGRVVDGYVRGARIYVDTNNNGVADPSEDTGRVTDAQGNFSTAGLPSGSIIATGGTNIDTGLPNTMVLKAPAGSTVVNPLTTVLNDYMKANPGVPEATAKAAVNAALGIPAGTDLKNYDPLSAASPTDPVALAAQKVAAQIVAATVLSGGNNDAVIANLVGLVGGGLIDLTSSSVLNDLYSGISGVDQNAVQSAINALDKARTLATSGPGSLSSIAGAAFDDGGNDAPIFLSAVTGEFVQNTGAGSVVYVAAAVDAEGGTVRYSLTDDAGGKFAIDPVTGRVSVTGPITGSSVSITVAASDGTLSSTETVTFNVLPASGSVDLGGSGVSGDTTDVNVNAPGTYTAVNVTATGASQETLVTLVPLGGVNTMVDAAINVTSSGAHSHASLSISSAVGTLKDITVNASGESSEATATIASGGANPVSLSGSHLNVSAGFSADAELHMSNVTGTIAGINLSAEVGGHASAQVSGIASTITYSASSLTVEATNSSSEIELSLSNLNASFTSVNVEASAYASHASLDIDTDRNVSLGSVTVGQVTVHAAEDRSSAQFTAFCGDADDPLGHLAGGSISVVASGQCADAGLSFGTFTGDVGDVTVSAEDERAQAGATLGNCNTSVDGDFTLSDSVIEVTASAVCAEASISLFQAAGSIASLNVETGISADYANASADLQATGDLSVGSITVHADGASSEAHASLSTLGDGLISLSDAAIEVTATETCADANLTISHASGTVTGVSVVASGVSSEAHTAITNAQGEVITMSGGSIDVLALGTSSDATLTLSGVAGDVGGISVYATGSAEAHSSISGSFTYSGTAISVTAGGCSSDAELHVGTISGNLQGLDVETQAGESYAQADVSLTGSISAVTLTAVSESTAEADIAQGTFGGTVSVSGDGTTILKYTQETAQTVNISARSMDAEFDLVLLRADADLASNDVSLVNHMLVVNGFNAGGDLVKFNSQTTHFTSNTADAGDMATFLADAYAALNSGMVQNEIYFGVVGGNGYLAYDFDGNGITGIVELAGVTSLSSTDVANQTNNLLFTSSATQALAGVVDSLAVDATNGDAIVDARGSSAVVKAISVTANNNHTGSLTLDDGGNDNLSLNTSGVSVLADQNGTATLNVSGATGTIGSLDVTARSGSADASANIDLNGTLGDIHVFANQGGSGSHASATISSGSGMVTLVSSDIQVLADSSGHNRAELNLYDAQGEIDSLRVAVGSSSANFDSAIANIQFDGTLGNITVDTDCKSTDASATISAATPGGSVDLQNSIITVSVNTDRGASCRSSDASLHLSNATGSIGSIDVFSNGGMSTALADIDIDGSVGNITVTTTGSSCDASAGARAEANISSSTGSVALSGSIINVNAVLGGRCNTGASQDAVLHLSNATGSIAQLNVTANGNDDSASASVQIDGSVATVLLNADNSSAFAGAEIAQSVFGGTVSVRGNGHTSLVYSDATAASVDGTSHSGQFDLVLTRADSDFASNDSDLLDTVMVVGGFGNGSDRIGLTAGTTHFSSSGSSEATFADFLNHAFAALDNGSGQNEVYFGVFDGNGYLAYDYDGSGITGIIELAGVTTFDSSDLFQFTPVVPGQTLTFTESSSRSLDSDSVIDSITVTAAQNQSVVVDIESEGVVRDIKVSAASNAHASLYVSSDTDVTMDGSVIDVKTSSNSADVDFHLSNATGTIDEINVIGTGHAAQLTADIHIDGHVGDIQVNSENNGCGDASHSLASANVTSATPGGSVDVNESHFLVRTSCTSSDAQLQVSHAVGTLYSLDVRASGNHSSASATIELDGYIMHTGMCADAGARAEAHVAQTVFGGSVDVGGGVGGVSVLTYTDQTAGLITVHGQGLFQLALDRADADLHVASSMDVSALTDHLIQVRSFDVNRDSITLNNTTAHYTENLTDAVSMDAFLSAAEAALSSNGLGVYFGVIDGDGYVAYDYDGSGITGIIELAGVTDISASNFLRHVSLSFNSDATVTEASPVYIDLLTVSATGNAGNAVSVSNAGPVGSVMVTADQFSESDLTLSGVTSVGSISLFDNGTFARVDVHVQAAGGAAIGGVEVQSGNNSSDVSLHLSNGSGSIGYLNFSADSTKSVAFGDIETDGTVGDIDVRSSGNQSTAHVNLSAATASGTVTMGTVDIDVRATDQHALAELDVTNADGYINRISVEANRVDTTAVASIQTDGTVGNIRVHADCLSADARATISAASVGGSVSMDGSDIQVLVETSSGSGCRSADATLDLNDATGRINSLYVHAQEVYGRAEANIEGDATIGEITVKTEGYFSAEAVATLTGLVMGSTDILVQTICTDAVAQLHIIDATGTIGSIDVNQNGREGSLASADIHIDGSVGTIHVVSQGRGTSTDVGTAYASISAATADGVVTLESSDVVVRATSSHTAAELQLSDAAGTIDSLVVGTEGSLDVATANISAVDTGETLYIGSVDAHAHGRSSEVNVSIDIDGAIGNISLDANRDDAQVHVQIHSSSGTVTMLSSDIAVTSGSTGPGGGSSDVSLLLTGVEGTIASLQVRTAGCSSDASATLSNATVTLGNVSVDAFGGPSSAVVNINTGSDDSGLVTLDGSFINVQASHGCVSSGDAVDPAHAEFNLAHATGSISYLRVSAGVDEADSRDVAIANLHFDGLVGDISVDASDGFSSAHATLTSSDSGGLVTLDGSNINVEASNVGSVAGLSISHADGSINSLVVVASDHSSEASANITIDGAVTDVRVVASGYSAEASATIDAASVGTVDVVFEDTATANVSLALGEHGGSIGVSGDYTGAVANLAFAGEHTTDTIDLGSFSGATHLQFGVADLDTVNWANLEAEMLHITGLDSVAAGLTLDFAHWGASGSYAEDLDDAGDLGTFEDAASAALSSGTTNAYFGVVGGNGYLAYDFDHTGVTGLIEMAGVTDFDPTKIQQLIVA